MKLNIGFGNGPGKKYRVHDHGVLNGSPDTYEVKTPQWGKRLSSGGEKNPRWEEISGGTLEEGEV